MKYTNKWMVVPFNPNYLDKTQDSVSNQLTKALESSSNPIEKLNQYNQILAKSKDHHHPVVPKKEEVIESTEEENDEAEEDGDISMANLNRPLLKPTIPKRPNLFNTAIPNLIKPAIPNRPNLFLPPPLSIPSHYSPKPSPKQNKKKGKSKVPAPYPQSAKKTRGFTFYQENGYLERPEYDEKSSESNSKKRKIIELDKNWDVYRK